jgi:hypothetical protein
MITYKQLQDYISRMTPEQLDQNVTVWIDDEFLPVDHAELVDNNEEDRLDDGHPILVIL